MKIVMTIAKNFATYCMVCSCSCVAAWTNAIRMPTTAATMIGGAESSSTYQSACCVRLMMSGLIIGLEVREDQPVRELDPAVDQHEKEQLERHRHRGGRQHHHSHRHQDVRDHEVDHQEGQEDQEADLECHRQFAHRERRNDDQEVTLADLGGLLRLERLLRGLEEER